MKTLMLLGEYEETQISFKITKKKKKERRNKNKNTTTTNRKQQKYQESDG